MVSCGVSCGVHEKVKPELPNHTVRDYSSKVLCVCAIGLHMSTCSEQFGFCLGHTSWERECAATC